MARTTSAPACAAPHENPPMPQNKSTTNNLPQLLLVVIISYFEWMDGKLVQQKGGMSSWEDEIRKEYDFQQHHRQPPEWHDGFFTYFQNSVDGLLLFPTVLIHLVHEWVPREWPKRVWFTLGTTVSSKHIPTQLDTIKSFRIDKPSTKCICNGKNPHVYLEELKHTIEPIESIEPFDLTHVDLYMDTVLLKHDGQTERYDMACYVPHIPLCSLPWLYGRSRFSGDFGNFCIGFALHGRYVLEHVEFCLD